MIQRKDKVTHPIHGNGIVENLSNNESVAMVDFKGVVKRCEVSNLQRGVNTYTPKPDGIKILNEVQKLQIVYRQRVESINSKSEISDVMLAHRSSLNESIQHLENILQGVGNEL